MNAYILDCIESWVKVNLWFFRQIGHAIVETVKEAVEVCRNE